MRSMWLLHALACLIARISAFRALIDLHRSNGRSVPGLKGNFSMHNQCTFPINALAQNGFFSPLLHAKNRIPPMDGAWHPPNQMKTKFTICVGFEFNLTEKSAELVKYAGMQAALYALDGVTVVAGTALAGTAVGGLVLGWSTTALVGAGIVCPLCAIGVGAASALTIYGFASGVEMIVTQVLTTVSEATANLILSKRRVVDSGRLQLPVYSFEALMFPDDELAQAAASKTIFHWAKHLQETDHEIQGSQSCSNEVECVQRYASRIHLAEGVVKAWVDMLNSKFHKEVWPAFHGERQLYIRGGLSLPEYNTALGGWLVAAYTPLFISEESSDRYEESKYAACTKIQPGMIEQFALRCKRTCVTMQESDLGKDICEARCEEKLSVSSTSGLGVCRGTHISTKRDMLGKDVCCAAGPQTAADTEEGLAFPKFCLLNSECLQPEEGNSKHEGKWACAEEEIPKKKSWRNDKTCWQAPLVANAGEDKRNLLEKFPAWTVKDEIPLY